MWFCYWTRHGELQLVSIGYGGRVMVLGLWSEGRGVRVDVGGYDLGVVVLGCM
jgi:hypothetical protein